MGTACAVIVVWPLFLAFLITNEVCSGKHVTRQLLVMQITILLLQFTAPCKLFTHLQGCSVASEMA